MARLIYETPDGLFEDVGRGVGSDTGPFAIIPEWLLADPAVSDRAVRLYALLARYADYEDGSSFPSRRTLADRLGRSVDSIDRAARDLEAAGGLIIEHRQDDAGDPTTNRWTVVRTAPARRGRREDEETGRRGSAATGRRVSAAQNESQDEREPNERETARARAQR